MHYYVYDARTGDILRTGSMSSEEACLAQARQGEEVGLGEVNQLTQRVDVRAATPVLIAREAPASSHPQLRAQLRIARLETAQLRSQRELALDPSNAKARERLQAIDDEISGLRADIIG